MEFFLIKIHLFWAYHPNHFLKFQLDSLYYIVVKSYKSFTSLELILLHFKWIIWFWLLIFICLCTNRMDWMTQLCISIHNKKWASLVQFHKMDDLYMIFSLALLLLLHQKIEINKHHLPTGGSTARVLRNISHQLNVNTYLQKRIIHGSSI